MVIKIDISKINKELKSQKARSQKENVTFRVLKSVINDFKKACEKEGLGSSEVIEKLMMQYYGQS